jgi:hypothetical protein
MEYHVSSDSQPHPWHYGALAIILILIVLFGVAVYVTGKSFSPQSFAQAAQMEALIAENLRHTEQMHTLQEADQADADAHLAQRRTYLTWLVFGLAASLTGLAALVVLTSAPVMVTWSVRRSVENLALTVQAWREIPLQPVAIPLPGGYTALPPAMAGYQIQDTRTGQAHRAGDDVEASPMRTHLEQVEAVRASVEQVARQDPRGVSAWLPGLLQRLIGPLYPSALPHRASKRLVFRNVSRNQNQKTKK